MYSSLYSSLFNSDSTSCNIFSASTSISIYCGLTGLTIRRYGSSRIASGISQFFNLRMLISISCTSLLDSSACWSVTLNIHSTSFSFIMGDISVLKKKRSIAQGGFTRLWNGFDALLQTPDFSVAQLALSVADMEVKFGPSFGLGISRYRRHDCSFNATSKISRILGWPKEIYGVHALYRNSCRKRY